MPDEENVFRTAQPQATAEGTDPGSGTVGTVSNGPSEMPPSVYPEGRHFPFLVEVLDALPLYETFSLKEQSVEADSLIRDEMATRGFPDTQQAYRTIVDELLGHVKAKGDMLVYDQIEKLLGYLRIRQRLVLSARKKDELAEADPLSLSPADFRKYMELKEPRMHYHG